jgi:membrane-associated protease RseP (regulator of RpoE activity)
MSEPESLSNGNPPCKRIAKRVDSKHFRNFLLAVVLAIVVWSVIRNIDVFGNILKVIIGFGAVILIHEFGHFVVAKLSGIKVEAFSIGFPPTLLGIRKTERGYRIRILPKFLSRENSESAKDSSSLTAGAGTEVGETEYRIGLIPVGGFVKMLGQDDTGPVKASNDPRSYANKPISIRMAVISAGVFLNAISGGLIFIIVFLAGIKLIPAVVGGVEPNSPAARAGLKAGDEIIEIAGESGSLDFRNILMSALLSGRDEKVPLKVKRGDEIIDFAMAAEDMQAAGGRMRRFGIRQPMSLTIAQLSEADANDLNRRTGLLPGDRIRAVDGKDVRTYWEFEQIVQGVFAPSVSVLAQRAVAPDKSKLIETQIRLNVMPINPESESGYELCHIYSMVPRLRIADVLTWPPSITDRFASLLNRIGLGRKVVDTGPRLQEGDIVLSIGDVDNPTRKELRSVVLKFKELGDFVNKYKYEQLRNIITHYKEEVTGNFTGKEKQVHQLAARYQELRDVVTAYREEKLLNFVTKYKGESLPVKVLRIGPDGAEDTITVTAVPKRLKDVNEVLIGIVPVLDMEHPVVAKTISPEDGTQKLAIPCGAVITAVDGVEVSNFYDIAREISRHAGEHITIDWRIDKETAGDVALEVSGERSSVPVKCVFADYIPFKSLERLYKAAGPIDAITIGWKKTVMLIANTYVSIKRLFEGLVGQEQFSGPVGIIRMSYQIAAEQPLIDYVYILGVISILLAVFNFLPLPPFDGGHVVLLLVEKVKGSALSERAQEAITYAGLAFIVALFLYLTFNDIAKMLSG